MAEWSLPEIVSLRASRAHEPGIGVAFRHEVGGQRDWRRAYVRLSPLLEAAPELLALLREAAADIEETAIAAHPGDHPVTVRARERDLELVHRIRAALAKAEPSDHG